MNPIVLPCEHVGWFDPRPMMEEMDPQSPTDSVIAILGDYEAQRLCDAYKVGIFPRSA